MPCRTGADLTLQPDEPSNFAQRLRSAIEPDVPLAQIAKGAAVSLSGLKKWLAGASEPGMQAAAALARTLNVNLEWLATGQEPMERGAARVVRDGARPHTVNGISMEGFVPVPRYDVRASAGPGALNDDENIADYLAFREDWIRKDLGTSPDEVLCLNAIGDSMEPTIRSGDVILIDRAIKRIADEAIYVVAIGEALLLKRVQPLVGGVELRSDNPLYKPDTLTRAEADNLRVYGRVRWIGRVV